MKIAVIKTGGKQYLVAPDQKLKIEKLPAKVGDKVVFDEILLLSDEKETIVGQPKIEKAKVEAEVLSQDRAKKITVIKYKPKVRYHKKSGHRQSFTEIKISDIIA